MFSCSGGYHNNPDTQEIINRGDYRNVEESRGHKSVNMIVGIPQKLD